MPLFYTELPTCFKAFSSHLNMRENKRQKLRPQTVKETPWGLKASVTPKWDTGLGVLISLTARRSNQSILKEINPEYSLEGLMLKVKLQYLAT